MTLKWCKVCSRKFNGKNAFVAHLSTCGKESVESGLITKFDPTGQAVAIKVSEPPVIPSMTEPKPPRPAKQLDPNIPIQDD